MIAAMMKTVPPRRYSAEIAVGIADAAAEPVGLLVERVEPDEQEQAGDREDHEVVELVARGQRHVREEQRARR